MLHLFHAHKRLERADNELRRRARQMQKHRDALLELAQLDKSDFDHALRKICALAAVTLEVARVSYWSVLEGGSALLCERLYLRDHQDCEATFSGTRLCAADCPTYFAALATQRPIAASRAQEHPATRDLAEGYLGPLKIASMLDAPVWVRGTMVGVLCHEQVGRPREWTIEEIDFVSALAAMVSLALEESQRARSERLLRESEAKFRALFEAANQGVLLLDEEKILAVNPAGLRILGLNRAEEIVGKHPGGSSAHTQAGGERAATLARKFIQECLTRGSTRFEWISRNARGEDVPLEILLTRISWGGRHLIQAVISDISERKRAEAELLRTVAREKELGQLRSKFVSMVSHEFRTPLGIIQSSAEILAEYFERLEPQERADQLKSIQKNVWRMAGLMEEVLLLGSFEAGKMEFKPVPLHWPTFMRHLLDEVLSATERRCPIELTTADAPAESLADERLLRHIFTNLLTNAVKYSDRGCPVRFNLARSGADLVATICDHGIGIPEADREWLFHAFHRGRNVGERPGTGLGLVIVKRCLDLHGGAIEIHSQVSEGTIVRLKLPIVE